MIGDLALIFCDDDDVDEHERVDGNSFVDLDRTDDAEQDEPAIGHQRAIGHHQQHRDRNQTPVGARQGGQDVGRVTLPEQIASQAGGDGRARGGFQGWVTGSVAMCRAGSCLTW